LKQDMTRALELAAACEHNMAQWLTRVVVGKTVSTRREARDIFLALGESDARGLCFAALLLMKNEGKPSDEEVALLRRSSELGFALAQAKMAEVMGDGEDGFRFATLGASQREREGFFYLGYSFKFGFGCEKNEEKARENYLIAAELGDMYAMFEFGRLVELSEQPNEVHLWISSKNFPNKWKSSSLDLAMLLLCFKLAER
jgi:TPR repeat protein